MYNCAQQDSPKFRPLAMFGYQCLVFGTVGTCHFQSFYEMPILTRFQVTAVRAIVGVVSYTFNIICNLQTFLQQINWGLDLLDVYFWDCQVVKASNLTIFAVFELKVFGECMWWNPSIHMVDFEFAGIYRRFLAVLGWVRATNQTRFSGKWILPIFMGILHDRSAISIDCENLSYIQTSPSHLFWELQSEVNDETVIQDMFCFWSWLCSMSMTCFAFQESLKGKCKENHLSNRWVSLNYDSVFSCR